MSVGSSGCTEERPCNDCIAAKKRTMEKDIQLDSSTGLDDLAMTSEDFNGGYIEAWDYKLIKKEHSHIAQAVIENPDVEIQIRTDFSPLNCFEPFKGDFFERYVKSFEYRLKPTQEEPFTVSETTEIHEKSHDTSINNGGETDYYQLKKNWKTFQDVIEDREMNYAQGNILKVACTFNIGRHGATDYERELNKIIFFAKRELQRIQDEQ